MSQKLRVGRSGAEEDGLRRSKVNSMSNIVGPKSELLVSARASMQKHKEKPKAKLCRISSRDQDTRGLSRGR